jgi:plasmid stabilization system protein ParE
LKILFAPEAEQDLDTAVNFLLSRNPPAAVQLVDGIRLLISRLAVPSRMMWNLAKAPFLSAG